MGNILIASCAIACVLTAVETFYRPIGKWKGLLSFLLSILFTFMLGTRLLYTPIYVLATTFVSLTISLLVDQLFTGTNDRDMRNLPRRVPPR